jgi:hypothetical protein
VGGLWLRDSKKGTRYMVGTMGGVRVLVFKNTKKRSEKDPDYTLCFDHKQAGGESPEPPEE